MPSLEPSKPLQVIRNANVVQSAANAASLPRSCNGLTEPAYQMIDS